MKNLVVFLFIIISTKFAISQGIINNGANIYVAEGADIVGGSYTSLYSVGAGKIELNGIIKLEGDWQNNSNDKNIFLNIEDTPNGTVEFTSTNESYVGGSSPTVFENIKITNGTKLLTTDACEISGVLTLNGILNLNRHSIILNNSSPSALVHSDGYILSETTPNQGLGEIKWHTEGSTAPYIVPFGSGNAENDLNIELNIQTENSYESGIYTFATYPTDENNEPFPEAVNSLDKLEATKTADRYWKIKSDYTTNPEISIKLKYTNMDIDVSNNPDLIESDLKIFRFNPGENIWTDTVFVTSVNESANTASISKINSANLFSYFVLANETKEIAEIPNGITPNDDGFNDTWVIENLKENTEIFIYNRWGNKVYYSKNYDNKWDGEINPSGAYFYVLKFSDGNVLQGTINILR